MAGLVDFAHLLVACMTGMLCAPASRAAAGWAQAEQQWHSQELLPCNSAYIGFN
jgi:hypothetical protein